MIKEITINLEEKTMKGKVGDKHFAILLDDKVFNELDVYIKLIEHNFSLMEK